MKKLLAIFSLALSSAFATDVTYRVTDFQGAPLGAKVAEMYPFNTPSVNGTNTVSSDRRTAVSSGNGVFTFTNVFMPNCYRIVFKGPYSDSTITNCFDARAATNSTVNGASYLTNFVAVAAMTTNYFIPKTNGTSYSQTLTNPALRGTITVNGTNINALFGSGGTNGGGGGGGPTYNFDTNQFSVVDTAVSITNIPISAVSNLTAELSGFVGTNQFATNLVAQTSTNSALQTQLNGKVSNSSGYATNLYAIAPYLDWGGGFLIDDNGDAVLKSITSIFTGTGTGLTNIPITGVATLATNLSYLNTNAARLNATNTFSGVNTFNGATVIADPTLSGDINIVGNVIGNVNFEGTITGTGTGLTNIPISGVSNLTTRLNALQTGNTTLSNLVSRTSEALNGAGFTNIPTSAVNTLGTNLSYLNTNAAKLNTANTFTAGQTVSNGVIVANAPALTLSQTWSNASITFSGLTLNVTDVASTNASALIELNVGGASKFKVSKTGVMSLTGGSGIAFNTYDNGGGVLVVEKTGTQLTGVDGGSFRVPDGLGIGWTGNSSTTPGATTILYNDGPYIIAQRNGATSQTNRLYSWLIGNRGVFPNNAVWLETRTATNQAFKILSRIGSSNSATTLQPIVIGMVDSSGNITTNISFETNGWVTASNVAVQGVLTLTNATATNTINSGISIVQGTNTILLTNGNLIARVSGHFGMSNPATAGLALSFKGAGGTGNYVIGRTYDTGGTTTGEWYNDGSYSSLGGLYAASHISSDGYISAASISSGSDIYASGDINLDGKLTAIGGIDPPYVLFDAESRASIKARVLREVPVEKQTGAAQFWNPTTRKMELYIASEDKFYDLVSGAELTNATGNDLTQENAKQLAAAVARKEKFKLLHPKPEIQKPTGLEP